ncbi:hypothetical protein [Chloroflexus sp.]|uniref:hypothetical protein n=1 Tax=Chloroflexus sp. TaxID=1904827 RepID=UPI00404B39E6
MAAGWTLWSALVLWLLLSLQAVTAIVYVRIRLRLARNEPVHCAPALLLHLAALVIVADLLSLDWVGWPVLLVFAFLFLRCWIGLLPRSLATPTPLVGVQEVIVALLVVVGIRFGLS